MKKSGYMKQVSKKKLKSDAIKVFIIGIAWILVLMLPWLFWLKPYKEFEHYECEAVYNYNILIVDAEHMKILYEVDGVNYEEIIWFHTTRTALNKLDFYYQKDDPGYIVFGRTESLIAFPCVASFGFVWCGCAIFFYKSRLKDFKVQELNNKSV